jgi:hypothetical protein
VLSEEAPQMKPMTVCIQFCGGCNPRIDRGRIATQLQNELLDSGFDVAFNNPDADSTIFLSGCLSGCAFKFNPREQPSVAVAESTVNGVEIPRETIVPEVLIQVGRCRKLQQI